MEEGDWVSITEAANRLCAAGDQVERSTLSRYLAQHAEALPLRIAGKSKLVEFGALAAHRAENVRLRVMPPELRLVSSNTAGPKPPRFAGSQSDGAARKAQADAALRELELGRELKLLTLVSEVDAAGSEAISLMRNAFDRSLETEAATLSLRYGWDERMVRIALKNFVKAGLDLFHRELTQRLDALRQERSAAPIGDDGPSP